MTKALPERAPRVLLLTGACGSGKTTIANVLATRSDWARVGEDELWHACFGTDRGAFGTDEHRRKRRHVHALVRARIAAELAARRNVALDATVHEAPPEAFAEYRAWFEAHAIEWSLVVLHPRLDVTIARDAARACWTLGERRVRDLRAKFTGAVFDSDWFLDTSDETAETTVVTLLARLGRVPLA